MEECARHLGMPLEANGADKAGAAGQERKGSYKSGIQMMRQSRPARQTLSSALIERWRPGKSDRRVTLNVCAEGDVSYGTVWTIVPTGRVLGRCVPFGVSRSSLHRPEKETAYGTRTANLFRYQEDPASEADRPSDETWCFDYEPEKRDSMQWKDQGPEVSRKGVAPVFSTFKVPLVEFLKHRKSMNPMCTVRHSEPTQVHQEQKNGAAPGGLVP
ncbi:hypothetical protein TNIN_337041 [Trichonephila inaurata madagascariensis]|uniref:Uncharacterized protein n=1 Tax=Trichonephila inaurata madagascariensis TaxID=2747483 RepID=A0A8X6YE47_9ARAC|nr:hypothetical protein TNIN_337041 [Trichonephila inaurata madagascariensis]